MPAWWRPLAAGSRLALPALTTGLPIAACLASRRWVPLTRAVCPACCSRPGALGACAGAAGTAVRAAGARAKGGGAHQRGGIAAPGRHCQRRCGRGWLAARARSRAPLCPVQRINAALVRPQQQQPSACLSVSGRGAGAGTSLPSCCCATGRPIWPPPRAPAAACTFALHLCSTTCICPLAHLCWRSPLNAPHQSTLLPHTSRTPIH
jgi:hypothetical protein